MQRGRAIGPVGAMALVAAAVLAGCVTTETLGDGATGTDRVHGADRPAFLEDGAVEDLDELFGATAPALGNRSHAVQLVDSTLAPDPEGRFRDGRRVLIERRRGADGAVLLRREVVDATGAAPTSWNVTTYRASADGTVWRRWNDSDVGEIDGPPSAGLPGPDAGGGDDRDVLDAPATAFVPHRNDTRVVTVTDVARERHIEAGDAFRVRLDVLANATTSYAGSALVGSDGVVYAYRLDEGGSTGGGPGDRWVTWSVADVGATAVERPDWVPAERPTNGAGNGSPRVTDGETAAGDGSAG